ncbi:hypothetical protein SAMN05216555_10764 [Arthrobacter cupressi]|uniref:Uncharacterized protein n=1 Tax=Arthrobacter cupressi TaxID=1045773 RepID=A0A1G8R229_9MICC|nr:hypothetical protein SAMN05216555_10764 [Arthrobacter cupressi]
MRRGAGAADLGVVPDGSHEFGICSGVQVHASPRLSDTCPSQFPEVSPGESGGEHLCSTGYTAQAQQIIVNFHFSSPLPPARPRNTRAGLCGKPLLGVPSRLLIAEPGRGRGFPGFPRDRIPAGGKQPGRNVAYVARRRTHTNGPPRTPKSTGAGRRWPSRMPRAALCIVRAGAGSARAPAGPMGDQSASNRPHLGASKGAPASFRECHRVTATESSTGTSVRDSTSAVMLAP